MTAAWWIFDYYAVTNFLWMLFVLGCIGGVVALAAWDPRR